MSLMPSLSQEDLLAALRACLGAEHVLVTPADLLPYVEDWRGRYQGEALCVLRPADTTQVSQVVALCARAGVAIVAQGGNTGLVGGGVPLAAAEARRLAGAGETLPQVVLSLKRLAQIRAIDVANDTITVEAGCTLQQVQEAAATAGRLFPLSLASEGSATIGGNLSTNAGGVQVLRYGSMRDLVLGLEVVLADGKIWDGLRALRKNNTGYDLKQLFIGAEGTLGVITAAVLKLYPAQQGHATAWLALRDPAAAITLLGRCRAVFGGALSAFELINQTALEMVLRHIPATRAPLAGSHPWQLLLQLDVQEAEAEPALVSRLQGLLGEEMACGQVLDAVIAQSVGQAAELWKLRESISAAQKTEGLSVKHDIAVPISRIAEFIQRVDAALGARWPGVRIVCFGHVGDGNLHYNPSQALHQDNAEFMAQSGAINQMVHDLVHELGGSISAEHGLGQLKREEIQRYKSPLELQLMQLIKHSLDPQGRLNPGKMLGPEG